MTSKIAVLINTNEKANVSVENNNILQYLCFQLINLKFIIKETCNVENNCEYLTRKLQNYVENSVIFLLASENEFVYEVLSKLFDEKLIISKHLASVYKFDTLDNQNVKKISVPCTSKIFQVQNHVNGINPVCIQFKNIFILPNDLNSVKLIFQNILKSLLKTTDNANEIFEKRFVLNCNQNGVSNMVNDKLCTFSDSVNINRYCSVKSDNKCELNINLISKNFSELVKCENVFKNIVSNNVIMNEEIDSSFWERMDLLKNEKYVDEALQIIKCCYSEYQPQDVFLCFNGGKDCTVLLYLILYVLRSIHPLYNEPLVCLYIQPDDPFEEVEEFIEQCRLFYDLELITIKDSIQAGLEEILNRRPNLVACMMGTRKTDPFSETLYHFAMTDPDWPQVMRVNPILDWRYSNVWTFLLTCKVPYCDLYDHGYTSLGGKSNSAPNPLLKHIDNEFERYWPAYKLEDESQERHGRQSSFHH